MGKIEKRALAPFNSPFELGIRMVYILTSLFPRGADLQKLILLDYAAIYSSDFGGPKSLHTPVPYRNAELYGRRDSVHSGIKLMATKRLIDVRLDECGITYFAGDNARALVESLGESYLFELAERCNWVALVYGDVDTIELASKFQDLGYLWETELDVAVKRTEE
ncbi:MAG: threonine transporter RhtB [Gammaproteobacteria bacterium]|nr:threonine transporter RhtB [Gammaproteobacteria bacterium]